MKRAKGQGTRDKQKWLALAVLLTLMWCAPGIAVARQQPPSGAAQEGFVPIDQLQQKEQLPAAPLVMAAYAVAWLVVFAYIWSLWRRLSQVEREIADVSRRLASGARR